MATVRVEHIMGMPVVVDLRDPAAADDAADAVFDWLRRVDATFSVFKPDSEVSRIDRGVLALEQASADVREIVRRCVELRDETRGFFDMHATGRLDPGGLVKGWAVDRAAAILDGLGLRNYAVDAGGDLRIRGGALPAREWRVGIQHPVVRDAIAAVVTGTDLAIATSGAYNRGDHVVDPHSRRPPVGVLSVTVTGPDLATADAYATAAFAMADQGPDWTAGLTGYQALTITADGRVLATPTFPRTPR